MTHSDQREALIVRLLDAHERSGSFGRPAPWPRDLIVRLDAKTFPSAFAPAGREELEALRAAALELVETGVVRGVRFARGPLAGELKELRAGPAEVEALYSEGTRLGYLRLSDALDRVAARAAEAAAFAPEWFAGFARRLARSVRDADTRVVGYSRERFKRDVREIADAFEAAARLASGEMQGWERVISERIFHDSKRLSAIRSVVVQILLRADARWQGVPPEEASDLLEAYGVRRKPGVIRCAGCGTLTVGEREYRIEDFIPSAHLPDTWSAAWVDAVVRHGVDTVTTVENEYPFLSYVDEVGGPSALGARRELVIYTAGFPTPSLVAALQALAERAPEARFRHWGDADVGGLRIWWFLRSRLGVPLGLFRTQGAWVRMEANAGGRHLSADEIATLHRMREELGRAATQDGDIAEAIAVADALIETRIKLEQERW